MTNKANEPRRWAVRLTALVINNLDKSSGKAWPDQIEVIEASAYDAAQKRIVELEEEVVDARASNMCGYCWRKIDEDPNGSLTEENSRLKALLEEAMSVFNIFAAHECEHFNASYFPDPYGFHIKHREDCRSCYASAILAKLKSEVGE